jgi:hypothetical protein
MRLYQNQPDDSSPEPLNPRYWYQDRELIRLLNVRRRDLNRARRDGKLHSRRNQLVILTRGADALAWWEASHEK